MIDRLKPIWSDAVGSKLIAQVIIVIGGIILSYFTGFWPKIEGFLQTTYEVPNWLLAILGIIVFGYVFVSTRIIIPRKRYSPVDDSQKNLSQLREDIEKKIHQLAEQAEIKILSPPDGSQQKVPVKILVSCKDLPEEFAIWVLTIFGSKKDPEYIVRNTILEDELWSAEIDPPSFQAGESREYGIFLVGQDGQALINHFFRAGREMAPQGSNWATITQLTNDIVQCGKTRKVILIK
jgi:hypothetical protein